MASWSYDTRINRYRDGKSGRLLSSSTVVGYRDAIVDKATTRVAELAKAVSDGTITPSDFAAELRKVTKEVYATQYSLGRGGVNALTRSDIGKLGNMLRFQYEAIDGFTLDLQSGRIRGDAIANRASLYIESSVEAYEQGKVASWGVETPEFIPPIHNRCRCHMTYRTENGGPVAYWTVASDPCPTCQAMASEYNPLVLTRKAA